MWISNRQWNYWFKRWQKREVELFASYKAGPWDPDGSYLHNAFLAGVQIGILLASRKRSAR